jgi:hypothetical protein
VLLGETPDDRRGAGETQGLGVFDLAAPVAIAVCGNCGSLPLGTLCSGLGFGARGRELFRGSGGGDVFLWRGVCGGGIALVGDECYLGPHVDRRAFGDEELLDLARHRRGQLGVDLVRIHLGEGLIYLHLVAF